MIRKCKTTIIDLPAYLYSDHPVNQIRKNQLLSKKHKESVVQLHMLFGCKIITHSIHVWLFTYIYKYHKNQTEM